MLGQAATEIEDENEPHVARRSPGLRSVGNGALGGVLRGEETRRAPLWWHRRWKG